MMLRALGKDTGKTGIPENAVVAFGVLEEETNGELTEYLEQSSSSWKLSQELIGDATDMVAAVKGDPDVFRVIQSSIRVKSPPAETS
jgi:hypothetical protein